MAPVIAQQAQMQHGGMMGDGRGMMGGMMDSGTGMMGATQSYAMAVFDTNKDGTLSPEEMTAGIQAEIKNYDTDASGSLSLDEFALMHAAHARLMTVRAFQIHDADGDGKVTEAEMTAMAAIMQDQMGGRQDGVPGLSKGMMDDK